MPVKPCPPECKFDWSKFFGDFDIAIAHMIEETDRLPTKTSLFEFMKFAKAKKEAAK